MAGLKRIYCNIFPKNYIYFICFKKNLKPFKNQYYDEIRKKHNRNNLFIDLEFFADKKSMCYSNEPDFDFNYDDIVWKRSSVSKVFYF